MGKIFGKKLKGFTLIELLVVIAIIGLLASIALVSVNSARLRANDAQIQTSLFEVRNAAEMSFTSDGNYEAVCNDGDNTLSDSGDFGMIEDNVEKYNGGETVKCYDINQAYAVASPLDSDDTRCWCVSSVGVIKEINCLDFNSSSCP